MRRFSLNFVAMATTLLCTSGAWAQADIGPLFTQHWDSVADQVAADLAAAAEATEGEDEDPSDDAYNFDMQANAVDALEDRWEADEALNNLNRFDDDFVHFWVPTGVIVETRDVLGIEGDARLITASLIDPEQGTGTGTSFIAMTYYPNGLRIAGQESAASAEQALEMTQEQLVSALSDVGSVSTTSVTRSVGSFQVPGVQLAASNGDASTMSFLTALAYQDDAVLTIYFHRELADRTHLDLLGAVMGSIWPGSHTSFANTLAGVETAATTVAVEEEDPGETADGDEAADESDEEEGPIQ